MKLTGTEIKYMPDAELYRLIEEHCRIVRPRRLWPQQLAAVEAELQRRACLRRKAA